MTGVAAGAVAFLLGAVEDSAGQKRAREARKQLDAALKTARRRCARRDGTVFAALEYVHLEAGEGPAAAERARRVTAATRGSPAWQAVDAAWDDCSMALRDAEAALRWFATAVDEVDDVAAADLAEAGERQELLLSDIANTLRVGTELAAKFASALDAPEVGAGLLARSAGLARSDRVCARRRSM